MNRRTAALLVLSASLALGLLADLLLRADPWGLNVPAGVTAFVAVLAWFNSRSTAPLARGWKTALAASLASAGLIAWRSSPALQSADLLFVLFSILTATAIPVRGSLRYAAMTEIAHAALVYGVHALIGPVFLVASDFKRTQSAPASPALRTLTRLARGGALAFPLLFVFAVLFMAADPVFNRAVHSIMNIDFLTLFSHLLLTAAAAWVIAGFLRGRFIAEPVPLLVQGKTLSFTLGIFELCVVLGSLILLFSGFVAVQFRYLFGGASLVGVVQGLTYSEYARRGFFELVTAGAFILPLLLLADWLFHPSSSTARTVFRVMTLTLICLVFLVMGSALQRMTLYQEEYGLTELRFFASVFMGWLALVLLWFPVTVLRGRRDLFFSGGFALTFAMLLLLHWTNPDEFIVRTNASRASEGKTFDVRYNASLGDDAVPALVSTIPLLNESDRNALQGELRNHFTRDTDWRSWTLSHWTAKRILSPSATDTSTQPSHRGRSPS